jgi:hypothetical protein
MTALKSTKTAEPFPDNRQRCLLMCLPALGLAVTAALFVFVSHNLLGKVELPRTEFNALAVRAPAEKKDDDTKAGGKAEPKAKGPMIGTRPAVDLGTAETVINDLPNRSKKLDVQTRRLGYLTTWTVANLVQGGVVVFVLGLAIWLVWRYRKSTQPRWMLWLPLAVSVISMASIVAGDKTRWAPLSVDKSVNSRLQNDARDRLKLADEIECMTGVGNISIVLVIACVPVALGVLLYSAIHENCSQRLKYFQRLLYATALLLVVGVIQVIYQNRMPALFFDDDFNVQQIGQMAAGTGLLVGGLFTVALGLVFLPAGFILGAHRSENVSADGEGTSSKTWLTELLAVLAPVLTALPISKLFDITS